MGSIRRRSRASVGSRVLRGAALAVLLPGAGCATFDAASVATAHMAATAEQHGALHRWEPGTTLRVDVSELGARDAALVFAAFDAWLEETSIPVRVRRAGPGEDANVVVQRADRVASRDPAQGLTRLDWRGPWIERAWVQLGSRTRSGVAIDALDGWQTLVHEIGHVLGLGHSRRVGSIMHQAANGSSVDAGDRAALTLLYASLPAYPATPVVASTRDAP